MSSEKGIATLDDLEAHIAAQSEQTEAINASMKAKCDRLNELKELLRLVDLYRDTKPVYDKLQGIKWKGKREKFERAGAKNVVGVDLLCEEPEHPDIILENDGQETPEELVDRLEEFFRLSGEAI